MNGVSVLKSWLDVVVGQDMPVIISEDGRCAMKEEFHGYLDSFRRGQVYIPGRVYAKEGQEHYDFGNADNNSLKAQADFVLSALGRSRMQRVVEIALLDTIQRDGSKIFKKSDREAGLPEPSEEDVREYVHVMFTEWTYSAKGFVFDPTRAKKDAPWKENTLYRMEAIISSVYVLLRLISYNDSVAAEDFQFAEYFTENFVRRLREGKAKEYKALKQEVPTHLLYDDGKIVRHLHPETILVIWTALAGE
jgi:hypothetical protein